LLPLRIMATCSATRRKDCEKFGPYDSSLRTPPTGMGEHRGQAMLQRQFRDAPARRRKLLKRVPAPPPLGSYCIGEGAVIVTRLTFELEHLQL